MAEASQLQPCTTDRFVASNMGRTITDREREEFMKGVVFVIGLMLLALSSAVSAQDKDRFTADELVGYRLSLVSNDSVGEFSFTDKGFIVATIGTVGGGVAGPILGWKIDEDGRLVIDFHNFPQVWTKRLAHGDLVE